MTTSAARKLANKIAEMITGYEDSPEVNAKEILPFITAALRAAEQRGIEKAEHVANRLTGSGVEGNEAYAKSIEIRNAIRALAQGGE